MVSRPITNCVGAVFITLHIKFFTFAKTRKNLDIDPNIFICFFDVSRLITNATLDETIKISSETLYDKSDSQPFVPKDVFVELIKSAAPQLSYTLITLYTSKQT